MIAGVEKPTSGSVDLGLHVGVAYYAQHQLEGMKESNTVLQEIDSVAPTWTVPQQRSLLGAFLFSGEDVDKRVSRAFRRRASASGPWPRCSSRPKRSVPRRAHEPSGHRLSRHAGKRAQAASRARSCSSATMSTWCAPCEPRRGHPRRQDDPSMMATTTTTSSSAKTSPSVPQPRRRRRPRARRPSRRGVRRQNSAPHA